MNASREFYVYQHCRQSDGAVFYVGKGKGRRAWSASGRSRHWKHVAAKHGFEARIVLCDLPEPCALVFEQAMIQAVGFDRLTNATLGGGGITGWKHSEETKRVIGLAQKGRAFTDKMRTALQEANANRVIQPGTRAKMSAAAKARVGRSHTAETRAKIAASHLGIRPTDETRLKLRLAKIGKACGRDSPSYDHTIRRWNNDDGRTFCGTRAEFIASYSLSNSCVSSVINGRQHSVKGWRLK